MMYVIVSFYSDVPDLFFLRNKMLVLNNPSDIIKKAIFITVPRESHEFPSANYTCTPETKIRLYKPRETKQTHQDNDDTCASPLLVYSSKPLLPYYYYYFVSQKRGNTSVTQNAHPQHNHVETDKIVAGNKDKQTKNLESWDTPRDFMQLRCGDVRKRKMKG